ncbi:Glia-derived nexin [Thelohanellus kitauei]|uniref:Glia-derived nexin n=1 Tax=Thelohanellus kitauei TaxID=669202 RepID=A0A0C2IHT8_THEKT|nr:Glia-derived nexin [Thelohanellus kitauei]
MSAEGVNNFTSLILNQLYASQSAAGSVILSGISLYLFMGAIDFGLKGRSHDQLSRFLNGDFEERCSGNWRHSYTATKWIDLKRLSEKISTSNAALFYSCHLYNHYQKISKIFNLNRIKMDISNPVGSAYQMNEWVSKNTIQSYRNIFDESMLVPTKMIFVHSLSFRPDWKSHFESELTKQEIFLNDKGQPISVAMMNQEVNESIYDLPDSNFRIHFKPLNHKHYFTAVVLPKEGHIVGEVLKNFKLDQMYKYFEESRSKYIKVKMPKFKISSRIDLVETFKYYGVTDIFDETRSNFGRMTNETVCIGNLIQVVNVDIDDVNVKAVTTETKKVELLSPSDEFYVTRPFLFFVYISSAKVVLISAVVTHPNAS